MCVTWGREVITAILLDEASWAGLGLGQSKRGTLGTFTEAYILRVRLRKEYPPQDAVPFFVCLFGGGEEMVRHDHSAVTMAISCICSLGSSL